MSGHSARSAGRYRELAAEEAALASAATTNESRARHYSLAAHYTRLAEAAEKEAPQSP